MRALSRVVIAAAIALGMVSFTAPTAFAQSSIPTAQAQAFLGSWALPIQGAQPVTLTIDITDADGQLAATVEAMGETSKVSEISKSGENLNLRYPFEMDGQEMTINIRLTPADDGLDAVVDVDDGMYTAAGTATKQ